MHIDVISAPGKTSKIEVSEVAFAREFNESLVHQAVVATNASARQGSKRQKNRSEVSGSTRKPHNQKGTGRARRGSNYDHTQRGGGLAFPARPRDFSQKINKKMYRAAIRSIFSELIRQERLVVVESLAIDEPKTKLLVKKLEELNTKNALILLEAIDVNVFLASRNIPEVAVAMANGIDAANLIRFDKVVITVNALRQMEEVLS